MNIKKSNPIRAFKRLFYAYNSNTLASILSLLNVKFTNEHVNKYFNEHPYKYSLFGLSKMLTYYGVYNMGIKVLNKEDIYFLDTPFIAHIGNDFVTVDSVSTKTISYNWHKKRLNIPTKEFFKIWSGAILVAEADSNSIEPNYKQHRKKELVILIQKVIFLLASLVLAGIGIYQSHIYQSIGLILSFILNLIGGYIGYLLVRKQIYIHSNIADKICSLFARSNCNDILNSPAAKLGGIIGWSELGFSYFLSNLIILLFIPHLLSYMVLVNILVLPYSFWSVWYQKIKVKTWCGLCLIVQFLFWLQFANILICDSIQIPNFTIVDILSVCLVYILPFLSINLLLPYLTTSRKVTEITQQFNSLKMNEKVFLAMLKERPFYKIDHNISTIILGNPKAKNTITVFSNPHCTPCAKMHNRIKKLIKDTNNQFCVQYILSSFSNELNSSCEFFFYVNRKYSNEKRNMIYDEWFDKGKYKKEDFFKKYSYITDNNTSDDFQTNLIWKEETKLRATPTVLFNGYELPDMFFQQIEKLAFFTNLEIDPK